LKSSASSASRFGATDSSRGRPRTLSVAGKRGFRPTPGRGRSVGAPAPLGRRGEGVGAGVGQRRIMLRAASRSSSSPGGGANGASLKIGSAQPNGGGPRLALAHPDTHHDSGAASRLCGGAAGGGLRGARPASLCDNILLTLGRGRPRRRQRRPLASRRTPWRSSLDSRKEPTGARLRRRNGARTEPGHWPRGWPTGPSW